MSTTTLKKQGKVEASDLYELAKKGIITHTGLFEVEGNPRQLKGLRGENKEKLENSEYLLQQGLVTVTFGKDIKVENSEKESGKEGSKPSKNQPENGKTPVENKEGSEGSGKEQGGENKEEAKPSVIKENSPENGKEGVTEGLPLSEKPEETDKKENKGSEGGSEEKSEE